MRKTTIQLFKVLLVTLLTSVSFSAQAAVVTHDISTAILNIAGTSTDDYIIRGTTTTNYVLINSQYKGTITLQNVNITLSNATYSPITVLGEFNRSNLDPVTKVNVILEGTNTLYTTGGSRPAFQVDQGAQISIGAIDPSDNTSGILTATTTAGGAGIGAPILASPAQGTALLSDGNSYASAGGNVIISSGKIIAKGGHGAGIGGGYRHYYNGIIVIYGGEVDATGVSDAAGIGSGCPRGGGLRTEYALESAIIVIPPAKIVAKGSKAGWEVAGSASITYIGDPSRALIKVQTEGLEPYANIYADFSETPSIANIFNTLEIPKDLSNVRHGMTDAGGVYSINAQLDQNITFFTDASSSKPETFGRPFKPVTTTVSSAKTITLPMLQIGMSFEPIAAVPLELGYTTSEAKANAYKLKVTYTDEKPLTGITFDLQAGSATNFSGLTFYGSDGVSVIPSPTSLSNGDIFYVQIPLKDGMPLNIYNDVLLISGTFDGAPTGLIRQVVIQRVVVDDTNTNQYIKVTATPATFTTNNAATATSTLTLNITHGTIAIPYNSMDVTARYLITTEPDYNVALSATPLVSWTPLNVPVSDGGSVATTASFTGKPADTYYIHWHVESGIVYAHSKTVISPVSPYGGFGPYIIDTTSPTVNLQVDGQQTTKNITTHTSLPVTLTFDEAIKNPATDLAVSDFEILPAGIATIGNITLVPNSGDKQFTAILTPNPSLYNGQNFTVKLKANAVTDPAGNNSVVSNTVAIAFANDTQPLVTFKNASTYSSLRPTFTVEISPEDFGINSNTDLFPTPGGSPLTTGANLNTLFVITPEGGIPLTTGYTAVYSKSGSDATAKGIVTITFTGDLINITNYTISLSSGALYNKLQNTNLVVQSAFLITLPDFTGGTAGISANPNLFNSAGGTTTLTIKGQGLKINADNGLLSLRVACPAIGYNSGPITNGFTVNSGIDQVTINNVTIPANTGTFTQAHTFELYQTFDGTAEISTGKTCVLQVEPDVSHIINVTNTTTSTTDLTFGYTTAQAQLAGIRQDITITNNGAQTLNDLTVTLTGADGSRFAHTSPSPATGLVPGNTAILSVYLQTGQNAGSYAGDTDTKVSVSATPENTASSVTGSDFIVTQLVNPKVTTNNGMEGLVTGNPVPATTWSNQPTVELTASALETGDFVKDWKYAVTATEVAPGPMDPAWIPVSVGDATDTYTFPAGANGKHYIFWQMTTNNITGITGQVENSTVKEYNIDLIVPLVSDITTERTVTNATPFKTTVTFDEPVSIIDATKFVAVNAVTGGVTPIGIPDNGQYTTYEVTITPKANLSMGSQIVISVQSGAVKDRAGNLNPSSAAIIDKTVTYNNVNPLVTFTTPDLTVNSNFVVTLTFSKSVTGLTESDFQVINGSILSGSLNGSGATYTFTIQTATSASGYIGISLPDNAAIDNANNGNLGGGLTVDYRQPVDRIGAVLNYAGPTYENGSFEVRATFSRNVTGLTATDFVYTTSDFASPTLMGGGKNYILTLTPLVDKDALTTVQQSAGISARDEYGNELLASNIVSVNYDTRQPQVSAITAEGGITSTHFDPFKVTITFDEPNMHSFDHSKLQLTHLEYLGLESGPVTVGSSTQFEILVQVAPSTPTRSVLTLSAGAGVARDKADNPNKAGAGSTPLSILFIDDQPPYVINVTPIGDWVPVRAGDMIFTFNEPINPSSNGKVRLEDFGYLNGVWINNYTYSAPHKLLAYDQIYTVYISGYKDPEGNEMQPATVSFRTQELLFPETQRSVVIIAVDGLVTNPASGQPVSVNSQDDFTFTVSSAHGKLDYVSVKTGNPLRDKEGIRMHNNPDGTITVTILQVTEPLTITVSLSPVANETIESDNVWAYDQTLYVETHRQGILYVYTLTGSLYRQIEIENYRTDVPLAPGFYTVVLNGESHMVIVK